MELLTTVIAVVVVDVVEVLTTVIALVVVDVVGVLNTVIAVVVKIELVAATGVHVEVVGWRLVGGGGGGGGRRPVEEEAIQVDGVNVDAEHH